MTAEEPQPELVTSDEAITERTGRGWEEWFALLDDANQAERTHTEIARWLRDEQGADGWSSQAITVSYERARGIRQAGEHADGFSISATKTIAVGVDALFDAFVDPAARVRWLPDAPLHERTTTQSKVAHYDWGDGPSRVHVFFTAKDAAKSTVNVSHERLADREEADKMKAFWRERVSALKALLEG